VRNINLSYQHLNRIGTDRGRMLSDNTGIPEGELELLDKQPLDGDIVHVLRDKGLGQRLFRLYMNGKILVSWALWMWKPCYTLVNIWTALSFRKCGYGTRLLRYSEQRAKEEGSRKTDVYDINLTDPAARNFFVKNGYILKPRKDDPQIGDGTKTLA